MSSSSILRRRFLQGVAAATAVTSVRAQADPLRIGMIGVGKRGTAHLGRLVKRSDTVIQAVCDIDPAARDAAQSAAQADNPHSYGDYPELLRQDNVDAVVIATPCHLHAEMAVAALRARQARFLRKAACNLGGPGPACAGRC